MKKWVLVLLLLCGSASANDLTAVYVDNISVADTVAASERHDTAYSGVMDITGMTNLRFFVNLSAGINDTNWTNDSFFLKFQHSFDMSNWHVCEVDTLLDVGSGWSPLNLSAADSVYGNWGRLMLIHKDILEADAPDLLNNNYYKTAKLWISHTR